MAKRGWRSPVLGSVVGVGLAIYGCGGQTSTLAPTSSGGSATQQGELAGSPTQSEAAGASTRAGAAGADDSCAAPAAELGVTPRADENLELLALAHSDGIVADQASYERVVHDVTAIRELEPLVAKIAYFARNPENVLELYVAADTQRDMQSGAYSAWDCLNASYRVTNAEYGEPRHDEAIVVLTFEGRYDFETLGAVYAKLPGVLRAEPSYVGGDGPTICLTPESNTWHYVFDEAGGDCPAGCTDHFYYHFTTSSDGRIEALETSQQVDSDSEPYNPPSWVTQYASPEACR
jgi:hypothetical protein